MAQSSTQSPGSADSQRSHCDTFGHAWILQPKCKRMRKLHCILDSHAKSCLRINGKQQPMLRKRLKLPNGFADIVERAVENAETLQCHEQRAR